MIKFICPHCHQKLGVPDEYAGRRVRCSKCQQPSVVPVPAAEAESEELELQLEESSSPSPSPADIGRSDDSEEVQRNAAIRDAARGRKRDNTVLPPISRSNSHNAGASEVARGMGKIPLCLGSSVLMMALCIVLWVVVANITGWIFGILVLLVPTAGAWGLTYFTDNRGVMMALLAAFLGFSGMIAGKVVLAKWVVYPMLVEEMEKEDSEIARGFNEGFREGFQETAGTTLDADMVQYYLEDEDSMAIIAAFDVPVDRATIKAMYLLDEETPEDQVDPLVVQGFQQAYGKLDTWDNAQKEAALRRHYTAYDDLTTECFAQTLQDSDVGKAVTGIIAFICSFGLLDLLWFPMGIYGAWKIGAGTAD